MQNVFAMTHEEDKCKVMWKWKGQTFSKQSRMRRLLQFLVFEKEGDKSRAPKTS